MFDESEMKDPEFDKEFWKWFDNLSLAEKNKFWYYMSDMAKIYFLNKEWKKIKRDKEFAQG